VRRVRDGEPVTFTARTAWWECDAPWCGARVEVVGEDEAWARIQAVAAGWACRDLTDGRILSLCPDCQPGGGLSEAIGALVALGTGAPLDPWLTAVRGSALRRAAELAEESGDVPRPDAVLGWADRAADGDRRAALYRAHAWVTHSQAAARSAAARRLWCVLGGRLLCWLAEADGEPPPVDDGVA